RIVGYEELIGMKDYISIDSPIAQALLKKQEGDEVEVKTPATTLTWKIHKIEYEKGDQ
ncbi:MAG: GreA/GreB family elongation factor, partial [Cytophagia bacterium]|nr:GreA/GreB family elongation factor [Cytophagia bacterium]